MQRRLPVAAALVHSRRIRVEHLLEELEAIEVRGGARVRNRACGKQALRDRIVCPVQRMEAAGPPIAAPVRVGAKLRAARRRARRCRAPDTATIAGESNPNVGAFTTSRSLRRERGKQLPQLGDIARADRPLESFLRRESLQVQPFDVVAQRGPVREPVLAREHELRVGEDDAHFVGERGAHARLCLAVATSIGGEEAPSRASSAAPSPHARGAFGETPT